MSKVKRKPRKKEVKGNFNLLEPIPLDKIGTDEDPCFATLFDPRCEECQRCGDAEICSIVMGQKNHKLRFAEEKKHAFKDLEELEIPNEDKKVVRKKVKNRIREMIKLGGGKEVSMELIINDVFATFGRDGYSKIRIKKLIKVIANNSEHITLTQNKLKWKMNTRK